MDASLTLKRRVLHFVSVKQALLCAGLPVPHSEGPEVYAHRWHNRAPAHG